MISSTHSHHISHIILRKYMTSYQILICISIHKFCHHCHLHHRHPPSLTKSPSLFFVPSKDKPFLVIPPTPLSALLLMPVKSQITQSFVISSSHHIYYPHIFVTFIISIYQNWLITTQTFLFKLFLKCKQAGTVIRSLVARSVLLFTMIC